ncbi:MAG TPA: hypothetical protein VL985_03435 [Stellaceae bacterium]|nr:hypothetical protein [Stellaceae bacterium]
MDDFYLDASPMIRALWENPSEFELQHHCVRHRPSRHWLVFDRNGAARIVARCNCAEFPISREQSLKLHTAVAAWKETYWRPLMAREAAERRVAEINREFARHFGPKTRWQRAVDAVVAWFGISPSAPHLQVDPTLPEDAELHGYPPPASESEPIRDELISA